MTMLTKMNGYYEPSYGLYKYGSIDSIDSVLDEEFHDAPINSGSEDLDNLSNSLSEASKVSSEQEQKKNVIAEIYNAQMSFWSLVFSFLYSYAWLQHRKKFMMTSFVIIPIVLSICFTIAWLLSVIIIICRIFTIRANIEGMFRTQEVEEPQSSPIRRRLGSTSSTASQFDRSVSCEELPRPLCRKHSTSSTSINLVGTGAASPSGRRSPSTNSRKFSYSTYTHTAAED
uniref:Transmembrane protein n=1 Tax=Panagrellus redivivus TaxID=6233 RepID=A0A7E4ZXN0_PANRE